MCCLCNGDNAMLGPLVPGMPAQTERSIQAPQVASALPHFVSPIRSMGHALLAMPYTKLPVSAESFSFRDSWVMFWRLDLPARRAPQAHWHEGHAAIPGTIQPLRAPTATHRMWRTD